MNTSDNGYRKAMNTEKGKRRIIKLRAKKVREIKEHMKS